MKISVSKDPTYQLIRKTGSISFEYDFQGRELDRELLKAGEQFVRDMALRGLSLYRPPGGSIRLNDGTVVTNPFWSEAGGLPVATLAVDWTGERPRTFHDGKPLSNRLEQTLDDSYGMVDYRIVGIFWAPSVTYEKLVARDEIKARERAAKNPIVFGPSLT